MQSSSLSPPRTRPQQLIFESPRLENPDDALFPSHNATLQQHDDRWNYLSAQAGAHKQDSHVLRVSARLTPEALRSGMPPQAARRITELHLPTTNDDLPNWLDAITATFFNLEHLYLADDTQSPNAKRVQRLYILYRLPQLKSIDGNPVTVAETRLARPNDPNGRRVRRDEWVQGSLMDSNEEEGVEYADDASSSALDSEFINVDLLSDVAVKSNDAGEPKKATFLPRRHDRLEEKKDEHLRRLPVELRHDQLEYVEAESSAACEWTAACGTLSLFRGDIRDGKFGLAFRRNKNDAKKTSPKKDSVENLEHAQSDHHDAENTNSSPRKLADEGEPLSEHNPRTLFRPPSLQLMQLTSDSNLSMAPVISPTSIQSPSRHRDDQHFSDDSFPLPNYSMLPRMSPANASSFSPKASPRASPSSRIPASKSLTSPFPMQFRVRARDAVPSPGHALSITTCLSDHDGAPIPPPPPRCRLPSFESRDTIDPPIPLVRVQSSPSKLNGRKTFTCSDELPPPCPSASRRVRIVPTGEFNDKAKIRRWKQQQNARSTSIIDEETDDSSEDDNGKENSDDAV